MNTGNWFSNELRSADTHSDCVPILRFLHQFCRLLRACRQEESLVVVFVAGALARASPSALRTARVGPPLPPDAEGRGAGLP